MWQLAEETAWLAQILSSRAGVYLLGVDWRGAEMVFLQLGKDSEGDDDLEKVVTVVLELELGQPGLAEQDSQRGRWVDGGFG